MQSFIYLFLNQLKTSLKQTNTIQISKELNLKFTATKNDSHYLATVRI